MSDSVNIDSLSIEVSTSAKKAAKDFDALSASMKKADQAAGQTAGMRKMQGALEGIRSYERALEKVRGFSSSSLFTKDTKAAFGEVASIQKRLEGLSGKMRMGLQTQSQIASFQTGVEKAENAVARLRERIQAIAGTRFTTPAFDNIRNAAEKQESRLFNLYGQRDKMRGLGVSSDSASWRALSLNIRDAEEAAARYRKEVSGMVESGGAFVNGYQTQEFNKLAGALGDATRQIEQYKNSAEKAGPSTNLLSNAAKKVSSLFGQWGQRLGRFLQYKELSMAFRYIASSMQTGIANLYSYSKALGGEYASALDKAKGASVSFGNSLAATIAPAIVALIPTIQTVVGWINTLLNSIAQLFAILGGQTYFLKAAEGATDYAKAAGGAGKANKDLLASFDQLHIIQSESGGGGGGGGGISGALGFEKEEIDTTKWKWLTDNLDWLKYAALAAGAALAGLLPPGITKIASGLALSVSGVAEAYEAVKTQWNNGVDVENMSSYFWGAAKAAAGLYIMFGKTGLALGLVIGGVAGAIAPLKEWIETGTLSAKSARQLAISVGLVGAGISLLTGSWIPLAIAALVGIVAEVVANWDKIKEKIAEIWEKIKQGASDAVDWVKEVWRKITTWFDNNIIAPIRDYFRFMWQNISKFAEDAKAGIENAWNTVANWVKKYVTGPIESAWNAVKSVIDTVVDAVKTFLGLKTDKTVNVHTVYSSETLPNGMKMQDYNPDTTLTNSVKPVTPGQISNNLKSPLKTDALQVTQKQFDEVYKNSSVLEKQMIDSAVAAGMIKKKANGGFARVGEMFIAREAGPELVGSIGNKTAVANNDQIVDSVAVGVATANREQNALLREQNTLLRALLNKESTVKISPSAALGRVNAKSAAMYGKLAGEKP